MFYSASPRRFRARRAPHAHRGFTVIELLVVIGIIALLAALVGFAMTGLLSRQKDKATRVTLRNLKSMLSEYEVSAKGFNKQPTSGYNCLVGGTPALVTFPPGGPLSIWSDADPTDGPLAPPGNPIEPDPFPVPTGNLRKEAIVAPATAERYIDPAIVNTQRVMGLLLAVPANRTILSNIPPTQLMSETVPAAVPGLPGGLIYPAGGGVPNPTLVLDAWGNPIIFVPAGGLFGMTVGEIPRLAAPTAGMLNGPIQSNDKRAFWASAGADGNFETGDDNIYSFEE